MTTAPDYSTKYTSDGTEQALEIGGRLQHGPSQQLIDTVFQRELDAQLPLFDALSRVDLAHSLVMIENGIIATQQSDELLQALIHLRTCPDDFQPDPVYGDLYTNREFWLAEHTSAASCLGAGRARREAITTAYIIKQRELLITLTQALEDFVVTLLERAKYYQDALMPDYTYLQSAQPTSFGHYLLGFAYPALRDLQRIQTLYTRLNQSPAGCGSTNGSRIPQSRERLTQLLGFEHLITHARDAMWQADLPIEMAATLTAVIVNLDRLAEDLQIFSTAEFSLVELDDRHARASKIMPQKKNPFALTHIRSLANSMIGTLASSAAMGRTSTGQPDSRLALYGVIPQAIADITDAVTLMSEVIAWLTFNEQQARSKLEHSFAMASDLAEVLVLETGLSFRNAHKLVGKLVHNHLQQGDLHNLTPGEIADCATSLWGKPVHLTAQALTQALNPETAIAARIETGGVAGSAIKEMLNASRQELQQASQWRKRQQQRLEASEAFLQQAIHAHLTASPT